MSVTATGPLTTPIAGLAKLVAASAQFQASCLAAGTTAANSVHWPEADDSLIVLPRAIVRFSTGTFWLSFISVTVSVGTTT